MPLEGIGVAPQNTAFFRVQLCVKIPAVAESRLTEQSLSRAREPCRGYRGGTIPSLEFALQVFYWRIRSDDTLVVLIRQHNNTDQTEERRLSRSTVAPEVVRDVIVVKHQLCCPIDQQWSVAANDDIWGQYGRIAHSHTIAGVDKYQAHHFPFLTC